MSKIFITRKLPGYPRQFLEGKFDVDENPEHAPLPREKLIEVVKNYDGILSTIPDRLDAEVLSHAKNLKVISNWAAGLIISTSPRQRSAASGSHNLPDTVTESTADLTLALFLQPRSAHSRSKGLRPFGRAGGALSPFCSSERN